MTAAEERTRVDADRTFAQACAERGGPILDHMATADVARDLDLLRQAVGDRQLSYVGLSYGAYLGATYANLYPSKVRALVLDGVPDPVAWATGRGDQAATQPLFNRLGSAQGTYATLLEFFRLCDQGGPTCAFSQGDPRHRFDPATPTRGRSSWPACSPDPASSPWTAGATPQKASPPASTRTQPGTCSPPGRHNPAPSASPTSCRSPTRRSRRPAVQPSPPGADHAAASPALLVGAPAAAVALLAGTATLWLRDPRPAPRPGSGTDRHPTRS